MYKKIAREIKKYNIIVIARHIGPDPDALGSSIGLKELILNNYPKKQVYVVGTSASRFRYLGNIDKLPDINYKKALLIVTDTPDLKRIDGVESNKFSKVIKIDHHPFVEKYADIELIDDKASSASQLIIELAKVNNYKVNKEIASKLYLGVVADTNRFLYDYTSYKTLELAAWLIKKTNLNFTSLYDKLYTKLLKEIIFSGYISLNMQVTDNGLAYIKLNDDILKQYGVDPATAGNLIENYNNIDKVKVVAFCSEDKTNDYIKCSIRSKGIIINEIANHYNGGGHAYASGARPKTFEEVDSMLEELDNICKNITLEDTNVE